MPRLRMTLSYEYEADPKSYGTDDPVEMAKIDLDGDSFLLTEMALESPNHVFRVEPADRVEMPKPGDATFTLTMNEKQARVVEQALDLHTRMGLGQVREIIDYIPTLRCRRRDSDLPVKADREGILAFLLAVVHELGFHDFGHSYGVGHDNVPAAAMVAYDLGAVLRNAIHSLRTDADKHYSVWGNRPMHYGSEPLAKVEVSDE